MVVISCSLKTSLLVSLVLLLPLSISGSSHDGGGIASASQRNNGEVVEEPTCDAFAGQQLEQEPIGQGECSIFMAPSSLKGLKGNGIFTTRELQPKDRILQNAPFDGPSIVLTNFDERYDTDEYTKHWIDVWGYYWWGRGVGDHASYEVGLMENDDEEMVDFQITFGSLPNHHCLLDSIEHSFPDDISYDDRYHGNSPGPSAGSMSYHMGRDFRVGRHVPAGSELFLNYGHCRREDGGPEWTKYSRMTLDYERAVDVTVTLWNALYYYDETQSLRKEYQETKDDLTNYQGTPLLDNPMAQGILYHAGLLTGAHANGTTPLRSLVPTTTGELLRIMAPFVKEDEDSNEDDTISTASSISRRLQKIQFQQDDKEEWSDELAERLERELAMHPRTPEWIREHGMCLEHLIPVRSQNIPEAGYGAISQHYIPQGDIVVPAPALHILNQDVLKLPKQNDNKDNQDQYQILLNYCFGHNSTTLLVCPVTNAILINHCSDRPGFSCPKPSSSSSQLPQNNNNTSGPNAKVQWASPGTWDPTTDQWLQMTIPEIQEQPPHVRGLSLEVIALRDIHPGEEVFIDYGIEWEQAWTKHVEQWKKTTKNNNHNNRTPSRPSAKNNIKTVSRPSVTELNLQIGDGKQPLEWLVGDDIRDDVEQHDYMETRCIYWPTEQDGMPVFREAFTEREEHWTEWEDAEEILEVYGGSGVEYVQPGGYRYHEEHVYWPCSVYKNEYDDDSDSSDDDGDGGDVNKRGARTYTVRIHPPSPKHHDLPPWAVNDLPRFLFDYPMQSIRYFVRPYQSDQHLKNAFRHPIGLPSNMIPEQWKNRDT